MPEKDRPMSTFIIHTHGRLQEWVAEEKGYFAAEGLTDYALSSHGLLSPDHVRANTPPVGPDKRYGAYQTYEQGREASIIDQLRVPLDGERGGLGRIRPTVGRC